MALVRKLQVSGNDIQNRVWVEGALVANTLNRCYNFPAKHNKVDKFTDHHVNYEFIKLYSTQQKLDKVPKSMTNYSG